MNKKVDDIARCKDCTNSYQCGSFSESYCKLQSSDKMINLYNRACENFNERN